MADQSSKIPSLMTRVVQAVRYTISGVNGATFFGPNQPLPPQAQEAKGRIWDYPVAANLNYRPRAYDALSPVVLKTLADNCDILRLVIETRKDQVDNLDWVIRKRKIGEKNKDAVSNDSDKQRIDWITKFFNNPNKDADWSVFVRQILEQHFVLDAVSIERVRNRGGELIAAKVLDGATISVRIDEDGGTPAAPSVAYQQILKGLPAVDFSTDELLYYPRNRRPGYLYGFPHVAQIYHYVDLAIKRVREQSYAYDNANAPVGFIEGAETMTIDQIAAMQQYWDSIFNGNQATRSKTWWVPFGSKYTELKREILFNEFDEWLTRVICFAFSIAPTPFIKSNNRATAEVSADSGENEGLGPTLKYVKRIMDYIIRRDFNSGDLEFSFKSDQEVDPVAQSTVLDTYVKSAVISIDEAREELGREAFGGACADPMVLTATGYVPVDPEEVQKQKIDFADATKPPAPVGPDGKPLFGGAPKMGPNGQPLPKNPSGALPSPAAGAPKAGLPFQAKGGKPFGKSEAGLFSVQRSIITPVELQAWAMDQGFNPPEQLVMKYTTATMPTTDDLPFVMVECGGAWLEKGEDGVRLYIPSKELNDRLGKVQSLDMTQAYVVIDEQLPIDALPLVKFDGDILVGPEEVTDITKQWDAAAHDAHLSPSLAQKEAGNYRKGHIRFQGLDISIENPAGGQRTGKDWQVLMPTHYGYIKGTVGADGDHVDVFVGPNDASNLVFVIDQIDKRTGTFDEHKVMLGYTNLTAAKQAYIQSYSDAKPELRIGGIKKLTMAQFKDWLENGDTTQPLAKINSNHEPAGTPLGGQFTSSSGAVAGSLNAYSYFTPTNEFALPVNAEFADTSVGERFNSQGELDNSIYENRWSAHVGGALAKQLGMKDNGGSKWSRYYIRPKDAAELRVSNHPAFNPGSQAVFKDRAYQVQISTGANELVLTSPAIRRTTGRPYITMETTEQTWGKLASSQGVSWLHGLMEHGVVLSKSVTLATGLTYHDQGAVTAGKKPPGWQRYYDKMIAAGKSPDVAEHAAWSQTGHMLKRGGNRDAWAAY